MNAFADVFEHGARFPHRGITGFVCLRTDKSESAANTDNPNEYLLPTTTQRLNAQAHAYGMTLSDGMILSAQEHGQKHIIEFGVTAKRRTRPAVLRNRIKRLLRESLRLAVTRQPEAFEAIERIVLVCTTIPEHSRTLGLAEIAASVERIITNAISVHRKRQKQSSMQRSRTVIITEPGS
jgi:ribonuclease P protein component